MNIAELIDQVHSLKLQMKESDYSEENIEVSNDDDHASDKKRMLFHSAKLMRTELKEMGKAEKSAVRLFKQEDTDETAHNSLSMDISLESASHRVTDSLYNHMAWLLTDADETIGDNGRVPLSQGQHEQVLNIAQDVAAIVADIPMPKQVGTAIHVLKETRSKNIVTLLNRFGHAISYQNAQRYIATIS